MPRATNTCIQLFLNSVMLPLSLLLACCEKPCHSIFIPESIVQHEMPDSLDISGARIIGHVVEDNQLIVFIQIPKTIAPPRIVSLGASRLSNESSIDVILAYDNIGNIPLTSCACIDDAYLECRISRDGNAYIHPLKYNIERPILGIVSIELGPRYFQRMRDFGILSAASMKH